MLNIQPCDHKYIHYLFVFCFMFCLYIENKKTAVCLRNKKKEDMYANRKSCACIDFSIKHFKEVLTGGAINWRYQLKF